MGHSIKAAEQERQLKQKELNALAARDKELDKLFEHLYEDNVSGKISDDRFANHYNCIGAIEIPDLEKLPENNVSVHTRQGVDVHYAACAG